MPAHPSQAPVPRVNAREAQQWLQSEAPPVLLDVREAWEFALGHLPTARNTPLSQWPAAIEGLGLAPQQAVLTYCHHGVRSVKAAQWLQAHGLVNVVSLDGGIDAWAIDVDDSVGRY